MNGIHDLGGMHGFGPIERKDAEPVFHHPWEGRVFAMALAAPFGIRRLIETIPPARYLAAGYYERWLDALEIGLLGCGALTPEELASRAAHFLAHPAAPVPQRNDPSRARLALEELHQHETPLIDDALVPRFAVGHAVRARNVHPVGHTRLPRYVRGRAGTIARYHGVHAFPDAQRYPSPTSSPGSDMAPQPLYSVRFESIAVWGDDGSPRSPVFVDLWESHLEPA